MPHANANANTAAQKWAQRHQLIDLNELSARLSVSPATIYRLIQRKDFPRPMKIGKASRWDEGQVNNWVELQLSVTTD